MHSLIRSLPSTKMTSPLRMWRLRAAMSLGIWRTYSLSGLVRRSTAQSLIRFSNQEMSPDFSRRATRFRRISGLELAYDSVERDVQGCLVRVVGLDGQIAAQLAVGSAMPQRDRHLVFLAGGDRLGDGADGGAAAGNVEHLYRLRALVAQLENSHDVLAAWDDAERDLRGIDIQITRHGAEQVNLQRHAVVRNLDGVVERTDRHRLQQGDLEQRAGLAVGTLLLHDLDRRIGV